MQQQQITQVNQQLEQLSKIDLNEKFSKAYPKEVDLSRVQISRLNVLEFISLLKRMFLQLDKEVNSINGIVLPYTFNTAEFGQGDVLSNLSSLVSYLNSNQFVYAENMLMWLVQYQLQNGFFDKSTIKVHSLNGLELQKTSDSLMLLTTDLKGLQTTYSQLIKEVETQKKNLSDFHAQKQTELQQVTNNLNTSNTNTNQIQNLLTNSTQSETKISSILEQVESTKSKVEKTKEEIDKAFAQFKSDFQDLLKKLSATEANYQELYSDFDGKMKFVESKHQYFSDRNDYLDSLIGREVGASLFETFKQRKTELSSPVTWWRNVVGLLGVLTFVAILAIFTNFFGIFGPIDTALHWENIAVNALKTLPFFFLLYYAIAQYNKERNFQEEYAFKSAAALTIKAYADILNDSKNKDELVLKAVYGIYRSPMYKSKETKEVNSVIDMVNDVLGKGRDVIGKSHS